MAKEKHPTERLGRNPKVSKTDTSIATQSDSKPTTEVKKELSKVTDSSSIKDKVFAYPKSAWNWFNGLGRNTKLASILVLVLVFVGLLAVGLSTGSSQTDEFASEEVVEEQDDTPKMGLAVTLQQGTLQVKDEEGNWADAPNQFQADEGDALRTVGAASRTVLTFDDGSALRLDANSEVEILSLSVERIVIRHLNGYTYSRVIPASDMTYIVETKDAQYEAEGTAFKTASSGDEQAVEVYQSTVHETILNKKPTEGEKLTVKNRVDPSKDGQIEKLDIEAVKQDQFMLWNKNLDEQDDNFKDSLGFLGDFEGPEITISSHSDGETVLVDSNASEGTIEFSGNTERGAKLTVQSKSQANSSAIDVSVGADGNFTTPVLTAPLGNSVFEFMSTDRSGNKTTFNIRINFQRKSAPISSAPSGLSILTLTQNSNEVSVTWSSTNSKDGYKLVWSESANPTYENNDGSVLSSKNSQTIKKNKFESGKTYIFRVCEYNKDDNSCSNYSSSKSIEIE